MAHLSFGDIKKITRRVDDQENDSDLNNKSRATQALYMFNNGKKPIDVATELDLPESEVKCKIGHYSPGDEVVISNQIDIPDSVDLVRQA